MGLVEGLMQEEEYDGDFMSEDQVELSSKQKLGGEKPDHCALCCPTGHTVGYDPVEEEKEEGEEQEVDAMEVEILAEEGEEDRNMPQSAHLFPGSSTCASCGA
eukprot:6469476-Amphidinium_carterae.1